MLRKVKVLRGLIMGSPGSGKGTQTSRIISRYPDISIISSGDLLRKEIVLKTKIGQKVANIMKMGDLVPDSIIIDLILAHIEKAQDKDFILDGFPRSFNQAKVLSKGLDVNLVMNLIVPEKVILDRIRNRYIHAPSGRIYSLDFNPPKVPMKDDITGEPLTKRSDDNVETFQHRLDLYHQQAKSVVEYYRKLGVLKEFEGETSNQITPNLLKSLNLFFP